VGYTNAGKSSLLNRLTGADVLVEDRLFSTLDATTRRLALPSGRTALVSDTVGFVRDLPHELVEAFRSTLEEAVDTDVLLHVVDASGADPEAHLDAVRATLADIGTQQTPELLVLNKSDMASPAALRRLAARHPDAAVVSAATGDGLTDLIAAVDAALQPATADLEVLVPYERGDVVAALHRVGEVLAEVHEAAGVRVKARVPVAEATAFAAFLTP
jgi:GTP-binding protein HflX